MSKFAHRLASAFALAAVLFTGLAAQAAHTLPAGYKEVEYINLRGGAKIEPGIVVTPDSEFQFKVAITPNQSDWASLFTDWNSDGQPWTSLHIQQTDCTQIRCVFMNPVGGVQILSPVSKAGDPIEGVLRNGYVKLNDKTANLQATAYSADIKPLWFCGGAVGKDGGVKFWYFRWCKRVTNDQSGETESVLFREYIPCVKTATGEAGVWDGENFYGNTTGNGVVEYGDYVYDYEHSFYVWTNSKEYNSDPATITYGVNDVKEGDVLSAPARAQDIYLPVVCKGWTLYKYENGEYAQIDEGTGTNYTVKAADVNTGRKLEWKWEYDTKLPAGYKEVEYIDLAGGGKILTGKSVTLNSEFQFKYAIFSPLPNWAGAFDDYNGEGVQVTRIIRYNDSYTSMWFSFMSWDQSSLNVIANEGDPIEGIYRNGYIKLNDATATPGKSTAASPDTGSFGFQGGALGYAGYVRFWYFRWYEYEQVAGKLERQLVPRVFYTPCVEMATGKAGFWDGTQFLTKAEGTVTPGPFVTKPETEFVVAGAPVERTSAVTPVEYGPVEVVEGETLTVPTAVDDGGRICACLGYKLYKYENGEYVQIDEGAGNSFTVTAADVGTGRKLEWQWGESDFPKFATLPDGYTQLLYLEVPSYKGPTFIDTKINSKIVYEVEFGLCCLEGYDAYASLVSGLLDDFTFGSDGTSTTKCYVQVRTSEITSGNRPTFLPVDPDNPEFCNVFAITNGIFSVNGAKVCDCATDSVLAENAGNIFIFNNAAKNRPSYGRIYYFRAYGANGRLLANLVPARDGNGILCLYDLVSRQAIYKDVSSSGDFVAGPIAVNPTGFYTSGAPFEYCAGAGAFYGKTNVTAGAVVSVPASIPFNNGTYVCMGYKLYEYVDGAYVELPARAGEGNSFTVTADDASAGRKLEWQWLVQYRYDAHSYVSRNLIAQWDGIDSQGTGQYDPNATTWVDLTGNCEPLNNDDGALSFKDGDSVWLTDHPIETTCPALSTIYDAESGRSTVEVLGWMPKFIVSGNATPGFVLVGNDKGIAWWSSSPNTLRLWYRANATTVYLDDVNDSVDSVACEPRNKVTRTLCQDGKYGYSFYSGGQKKPQPSRDWNRAVNPNQTIIFGDDNLNTNFMFAYESVRVYSDQLTDHEIAYNAAVDRVRFLGADADETFDALGSRRRVDGTIEHYFKVGVGAEDGLVQVKTNGVALAAAESVQIWIVDGTAVEVKYLPNQEGEWRYLSGAPAGAEYPDIATVTFVMPFNTCTMAAVPFAYADDYIVSTSIPTRPTPAYDGSQQYAFADVEVGRPQFFARVPLTVEESVLTPATGAATREMPAHVMEIGEAFVFASGTGGEGSAGTVLLCAGDVTDLQFACELADYPFVEGGTMPDPEIRDAKTGTLLTRGTDYDLAYENNLVPGTANLIIIGRNGHAGVVQRLQFIVTFARLVTPDAPEDGTGEDWEHPMNITNAVNGLTNGTYEIWCKAGTYDFSSLTNAIELKNIAVIRGGYAGNADNPPAMDPDGVKTIFDGGGTAPGAIYDTYDDTSLTFATKKTEIVNCAFTRFTARAYWKTKASSLTFTDCDFLNNTATNLIVNRSDGGCAFSYMNEKYTPGASLVFKGCRFEGNIRPSQVAFEEMTFYVNTANVTIDSCLFLTNGYATANSRQYHFDYDSGEVINFNSCAQVNLRNVRFVANIIKACASASRGITCSGRSAFTAENCAFVGNQLFNSWRSSESTYEGDYRGILSLTCTDTRPVVRNCTFAYNLIENNKASVLYADRAVTVENCIFWNNRATAFDTLTKDAQIPAGSTILYTLCDSVEAGASFNVVPGDGSVVEDPIFVSETTMDELIGESNGRIYLKYDDPETLAKIIALDVHLKSPAGYCTNDGTWQPADEATPFSPAVDKGNPDSAWANEPAPNGARVNIGCYGNTAEASKTPASEPALGDPVVTFEGPYTQPTVTFVMGGDGAFSVDVTIFASSNGTDWVSTTHAMKKGESFDWLVPTYFPVGGQVHVKASYTHQGETTEVGYAPINVADGKVLPPWAGKGGDPTRVIHLRAGATGKCDGTSWTDAYTKLSDALRAISTTRCEVWIAGTNLVDDADKKLDYIFPYDIYFRGGFDGHECTPAERTPGAVSVLDGQDIATILHLTMHGWYGSDATGWVQQDGSITIESLEFRHAYESAVNLTKAYAVLISNCVFTANAGRELDASGRILNIRGNANVSNGSANIKIVDTVFKENIITNTAEYKEPGHFNVFADGKCTLENCLFVSNGVPFVTGVASDVGSSGKSLLIELQGANLAATGCRFVANRRRQWWMPNTDGIDGSFIGSFNNATARTYCFTNCLFLANEVVAGWTYDGREGFIIIGAQDSPTVDVVNCTFAYNVSQHSGTADWTHSGMGIRMRGSWTAPRLFVRNTIFHGNRMKSPTTYREIDVSSYDNSMYYKDAVQISYSSFDTTNAIESVCGITNAVREGVLFGDAKLVTTTNDFARLIKDMDGNPCLDWDEHGAEIMALNVHLQGRGGYIDETTGQKVKGEGKTSPCVDTGDPESPWRNETRPAGHRVNMGYYGNTPYQTQTVTGGVFSVR